jgi:signal transduction histidine kinase
LRFDSLTTRWALTLLLSAVVPFVAFGTFGLSEMRRRLETRVADVYLPDAAASAADQVSAWLELVQQRCAVLQTAARQALDEPARVPAFRELVQLAPGIDADFDLVVLADSGGRIVAAHSSPRLDAETRAFRDALMPESVTAQPWFTGARERGQVWQDRHLSPFRHRSEEPPRSRNPEDYSLGLAYAVPGLHGTGVLYALVRWQEIQRILGETQRWLATAAGFPSAQAFVAGSDGLILAHTERGRYATRLEPAELLAGLERGGGGKLDYADAQQDERMVGFARIQSSPGFDWTLGLDVRAGELFATSQELGQILLLVIVGLVLLLLVSLRVTSRAVLHPIHRIADATRDIARGDLDVRVPATGPGELNELATSFNAMTEELGRSRERLREAEREKAWAEMARQVAHEIKNPLTPMRMSAQLVLRARQAGDQRLAELTERLARTVLDQTDALTRIASDFRQFAGPPQRRFERILADELLAGVRAFYGAMADGPVRIAVEPDAGGAEVEVDRQEITRVFLNLIDNAVAACNGRGLVRVRSERARRTIAFRVEDDGPGIPQEALEHLFEPYFTTKSSGTGLGLAICRRILQAHGGSILLETSRPGCTVFRFELPIAPAAAS